METKHTPGPWTINQEEGTVSKYRIYSSNPDKEVLGANIGWFDPDQETSEQGQANAELIASAPDLLRERDELKTTNAAIRVSLNNALEREIKATDKVIALQSLNAELLEALKECDSILDRSDVAYHLSQKGDMALRNNLVRKVRQAINKAEGRAE